jgi:hypothetical protein
MMSIFARRPCMRRWLHLTPDRLVLLLLAVEGLLWLSDRLGWPAWHKGYAVLVAVASVGVFFLLMLLWFAIALIFRWRFQFSIRSLLVLTVAVAVPCSWMAVEMKRAREQKEAVAAIRKVGQVPRYDWEFDVRAIELPKPERPGPEWLWDLLGEDFFADVVRIDGLSGNAHAWLEYTHGLIRLGGLWLCDDPQLTDAQLEHIKGLAQLRFLELNDTPVTDAGLEHVGGLDQIQDLYLSRTKVTDAGLRHIRRLTRLQELRLVGTQVTDAGLEHLRELPQLHKLYLANTLVTDSGAKRLREALPSCEIIWKTPTEDEWRAARLSERDQ